jgi:hypothetical protein
LRSTAATEEALCAPRTGSGVCTILAQLPLCAAQSIAPQHHFPAPIRVFFAGTNLALSWRMTKTFVAFSLGLFGLAAAGCSSAPAGTSFSVLESCFATASGRVQCMPTPGGPQTQPTDVDHDGVDDTFVCASGPAGTDDHDANDRDHDGVADDEDCDTKGCVAARADDDDHADHDEDEADAGEHHSGRPDASNGDDEVVCPAGTV